MKHSSSDGCLSLYHSIPFPLLRGYPKSEILYTIWELFGAEMTPCGAQWAHLCSQKYFQSSLYILGRLAITQVAMYASP